jgi:MFS family permease
MLARMSEGRWGRLAHEPRWVALVASFLTLVLVQGATYTFPVFLVPLVRALGGHRGAVAAAFSVHHLLVGVVATVVDPLMGRFGERRVLGLGALIAGAGFALSGTARSPLELICWFGVVAGAGAGLLGSVAQTVMLSRWFPTARGTVNGVALSGMGIGIFLFSPLAALLIARLGWRGAFLAVGIGVAVLLIATNARLPSMPREPPRAARPGRAGDDEVRLRQIVPTARFWCFVGAFFLTPVSNLMVATHAVAHIAESGIDPRWAATAFGLMGLLSGVGRAGFGALSDRWGRVPTALCSYAATAGGVLALLLLAPGSPPWLLYAFVVPFGLTFGARGPIISALAADVYGGRTYGPVLGLITLANRVGSAVGPWLGGMIHDATGSYRLAFAVALSALALSSLAFSGAGWAGRTLRVRRRG